MSKKLNRREKTLFNQGRSDARNGRDFGHSASEIRNGKVWYWPEYRKGWESVQDLSEFPIVTPKGGI